MDESSVLAFLAVGLVTVLAYKKVTGNVKARAKGKKSFSDMPTVPGWPIVGSALQVNRQRPDLTFIEWAKQYGPMYKVKVFNKTMVVVSGYEEMHELLVTKGQAYAGRNEPFKLRAITSDPKLLHAVNGNQSHWPVIRKAAYRGIRHYGDGLTRLEKTLAAMAQTFVDRVKLHEGKTFDLREYIYNYIVMISVTMVSGKQVEDETDEMVVTMKTAERYMSTVLTGEGYELDFYPWLRHFGHPTFKKIKEYYHVMDRLWDDMWQYSQANYTSDGDATCIMHSIAQLLDKDSPHYDPSFQQEDARGLFAGLVLASILTTSSFLYALPNILLHNPGVYKRIQQEVDEVIGADRQPSIFDRDAMPYCVATILELLRYAATTSTTSHMALEDTSLGDYDIPAGTTFFPFFPVVLHDKEFWGDPDVFRPDRFLDSDGSLLPADHPNRKHMVQFGAGARICVGEQFAQKRMFIFLTSLVQAFDLQPGSDTLVPCDYNSYLYAGILAHCPYTVKLTAR